MQAFHLAHEGALVLRGKNGVTSQMLADAREMEQAEVGKDTDVLQQTDTFPLKNSNRGNQLMGDK